MSLQGGATTPRSAPLSVTTIFIYRERAIRSNERPKKDVIGTPPARNPGRAGPFRLIPDCVAIGAPEFVPEILDGYSPAMYLREIRAVGVYGPDALNLVPGPSWENINSAGSLGERSRWLSQVRGAAHHLRSPVLASTVNMAIGRRAARRSFHHLALLARQEKGLAPAPAAAACRCGGVVL